MSHEQDTVQIFIGPGLIAKGLETRLNELDIVPIIKDDQQSAITGGFSSAIPNEVRMFIRQEELDIAKEMIDKYLDEVGEDY